MKARKMASIYSFFMGISMIAMWSIFYVTNSIPEIQTKPIELGMHIAAEFLTAILLIAGAIGLFSNKNWGLKVYLLSMGMLLYTLIMSPGYFFQQGQIPFVVMFIVFIVLAVAFIILSIVEKVDSK